MCLNQHYLHYTNRLEDCCSNYKVTSLFSADDGILFVIQRDKEEATNT
jgi:hypothetical protein